MSTQNTEELNIFEKIAAIRKQVEVIQKNGKGYNYTYVTEDEILAKITGLMEKYGLLLLPGITPGTFKYEPHNFTKTKLIKDKDGIMHPYEESVHENIVSADMTWTWIDIKNPTQRYEAPWILAGQQADVAQAVGSGLTYTFRYFLLKFFNVATPNDDPDNWRRKQKEAEAAEDKMLASKLIVEFDTMLRNYLSENPNKTEEVKKFAAKYAKNGNYFAITESAMAAKITNDFKITFLKENN